MQSSRCFVGIIIYASITSISYPTNDPPQAITYQGMLTTLRNRVIPASYLEIAGKTKCIPMYIAPNNTDTLITCLSYNPRNRKEFVNLKDIEEIEIPYPYAPWRYNSLRRHGKGAYLLLKITWHDKTHSATHYLIETTRRLSGIVKRKTNTFFSQIPFSGFKKCTFNPMPR